MCVAQQQHCINAWVSTVGVLVCWLLVCRLPVGTRYVCMSGRGTCVLPSFVAAGVLPAGKECCICVCICAWDPNVQHVSSSAHWCQAAAEVLSLYAYLYTVALLAAENQPAVLQFTLLRCLGCRDAGLWFGCPWYASSCWMLDDIMPVLVQHDA
jgi:hypothetical protein